MQDFCTTELLQLALDSCVPLVAGPVQVQKLLLNAALCHWGFGSGCHVVLAVGEGRSRISKMLFKANSLLEARKGS